MASFICDRCGKCCVSLGSHITVERQLNDRDYYCRSAFGNALFIASVDPDYRDEISDEFASGSLLRMGSEMKQCTFLRKKPVSENDRVCAIYATRPAVCRNFRCYHMLVRDRERNVCGRVNGKNSLRTGNTGLEELWNAKVLAVPTIDPALWKKTVSKILGEKGYCLDPIE